MKEKKFVGIKITWIGFVGVILAPFISILIISILPIPKENKITISTIISSIILSFIVLIIGRAISVYENNRKKVCKYNFLKLITIPRYLFIFALIISCVGIVFLELEIETMLNELFSFDFVLFITAMLFKPILFIMKKIEKPPINNNAKMLKDEINYENLSFLFLLLLTGLFYLLFLKVNCLKQMLYTVLLYPYVSSSIAYLLYKIYKKNNLYIEGAYFAYTDRLDESISCNKNVPIAKTNSIKGKKYCDNPNKKLSDNNSFNEKTEAVPECFFCKKSIQASDAVFIDGEYFCSDCFKKYIVSKNTDKKSNENGMELKKWLNAEYFILTNKNKGEKKVLFVRHDNGRKWLALFTDKNSASAFLSSDVEFETVEAEQIKEEIEKDGTASGAIINPGCDTIRILKEDLIKELQEAKSITR